MKARRIFLVEDEPIIASGIERKIVQLGYHVAGSAASGEAAIAEVVRTRPDLVLMDIKLEGQLDGIETAEAIRKQLDVPVVFLTAYADEATVGRATEQDPFGYIVKPFSDRELFGAIEVSMHRHQLHRELRARAERYQMLSEVLSDFAFSIRMAPDPEKDEIEWRVGSLEKLFGRALESLGSIEDAFYAVHPEDIHRVRAYWGELRSGNGGGIEFRVLREEGRINWIKMDGKVLTGEDGTARLYGALQNITALREAEERLEQREFEFSQIVQSMQQGIWVGDSDNICIYANKALCDMTQYSREEIVGRNSLAMLIGGESETDDRVRTSSEPREIQFHRKDGELMTALVTPRRIEDENGEFRGSFNLIVDVTRQRENTERLRRSKRQLEGVFHASPAPSLIIDSATNAVLDVNEAFVSLTGFDRDTIVGSGGFGLADYEDLDDLNRMVSLLKERVTTKTQIRIRTRNRGSLLFAVEVREIVVDAEELLLLILSET